MRFLDGLQNLVAQLGVGKSKAAVDTFSLRYMTDAELSALYRSDWLGRKIVDAPVFDMLREWRQWNAEDDEIAAMEDAEERWQLQAIIGRALQYARLYGGGAILIGANGSNPEIELKPIEISRGSLKYLTAISRVELQAPEIERDPQSKYFGRPKYFILNAKGSVGVKIHPSRVIYFVGADRLDPLVSDGWGDSVLAAAYDAIHHAALAQASIAELLHEAKVDVINVPDLDQMLTTPQGEAALVKRFTSANTLKSINNMLLLGKDETWNRKQTSFAGMPDVLDRYMQIVAAAADMPATRLLGMAPKGMNSTGEGDLRNYYDMLAGVRSNILGPNLKILDRIIWLDALGRIPKDAYAEWRPMWQLTPKEQSEIAKSKAETTQIYVNAGVFDENAFRVGIANQLIEDAVYPGLEAAIADLQPAGDGEGETPEAKNDNSPADRAKRNGRNRALGRA